MTVLRLISLAAGLMVSLGAAAQSAGSSTRGPAKPADPAAATAAAEAQLHPASVPLTATDESRREAHALGVLLRFPERARATVAQMRDEAIRATAERTGKPSAEAASIVDTIIMPGFKDVAARIEGVLVENLAAGFTAAELIQMRTFFASPIGQRWLQSMPSVERDDQRQIQVLGQEAFRDTVNRNADALRAHGVNF